MCDTSDVINRVCTAINKKKKKKLYIYIHVPIIRVLSHAHIRREII